LNEFRALKEVRGKENRIIPFVNEAQPNIVIISFQLCSHTL